MSFLFVSISPAFLRLTYSLLQNSDPSKAEMSVIRASLNKLLRESCCCNHDLEYRLVRIALSLNKPLSFFFTNPLEKKTGDSKIVWPWSDCERKLGNLGYTLVHQAGEASTSWFTQKSNLLSEAHAEKMNRDFKAGRVSLADIEGFVRTSDSQSQRKKRAQKKRRRDSDSDSSENQSTSPHVNSTQPSTA